jgi:ketosteroid isomerase-like protein
MREHGLDHRVRREPPRWKQVLPDHSSIGGDPGVLPWVGQKSGRSAIIDFVNDLRAMLKRISFEVHDILSGDDRAVILGSLASRIKRTGKIVKTDFAIVLTVTNDEIVRFQMLEDSFAVSQAAR